MLIDIWPGDCKTKFKRTNQKVDEYNGKSLVKWDGQYQKVCRFSRDVFLKNIGCLVSDPTFGLGGSRMWEKEKDI